MSKNDLATHEVVHSTGIVMDMIDRHLLQHAAVRLNPAWLALSKKLYDSSVELYSTVVSSVSTRRILKDIIRQKSYRKGKFMLSSEQPTDYFFDLKPTILDPRGANLIADAVLSKLETLYGPNEFGECLELDAVGGMAIGAVPIASVVSAKTYQRGAPLPAFFVRKATKDHGTEKLIEGELTPDMHVVLIEDVTTTAGSVIAGIKAIREFGCHISDVITVVDRLEGAEANLQPLGVTLHALFTREDFDPVPEDDDDAEIISYDEFVKRNQDR